MRIVLAIAVAAIFLTLMVGCAEAIDDKTATYNLQMVNTILAFISAAIIPLAALWIKSKVDKKLDVQQEELLNKSDRQTNAIVKTTTKAVEEVGEKAAEAVLEVAKQQVVDDGRRDRRATDKPIIGG